MALLVLSWHISLFQPKVCISFFDWMLKATSFNDIAIVTVKETDYSIHTMDIIRDKVINILRNVDLTEKTKPYKT